MGIVTSEVIEPRKCSCGQMVDHRVLKMERGADTVINTRAKHNAPCGRVCFESAGVSMAEVTSGKAHHHRRCECLKVGRGYQ